MSHYIVKSISVRDGDVWVTARDSNTFPATYFHSTLLDAERLTTDEQLGRFGRGFWMGDFQPLPSCKSKLMEQPRFTETALSAT